MTPHDLNDKISVDLTKKNKVVLVGNPNVGKSVIFGLLTGRYVTVSNYPGTTVEVTQGLALFDPNNILIDTPGINNLIPQSEDERVTRDILLREKPKLVIQVADAKNLRRALFITLQLAEMKIPFVLVLNMDDEARARGISIDTTKLSDLLGVDVITTVATQRQGIRALIKSLATPRISTFELKYELMIESTVKKTMPLLPETPIARKSLALMLLAGDESLKTNLAGKLDVNIQTRLAETRKELHVCYIKPLSYVINQNRLKQVDRIIDLVLKKEESTDENSTTARLGRWAMHPIWGLPFMLLILYLTYLIVGQFAAGTCVDFLQEVVFNQYINPVMINLVNLIPIPLLQELMIGEYGLITMALTYAIAIVLPIVGFFFIIFGLLEDSGYLPRLAIMVNRIFKMIGLTGKSVLPMVLGLGCATMATMTCRILPTRKERIIVTLLLALAIPCSAQLGVIFGETSAISLMATLIWAGGLLAVIMMVGYLASRLLPGKSSDFIMEIPPLRIPQFTNIIIKTLSRVKWYLKEALPLFVLGTLVLFIMAKTGVLTLIEDLAAPVVVNLLQLPKETTAAFIMGFLRRDYAIVIAVESGQLAPIQILVAIFTITLFVPCIANVFMIIKEQGLKVALLIVSFVFVFAFAAGGLFNFVLRWLEVTL